MRRRYKLLIIIFISFFLVLIIYFTCHKDSYLYFAIGDNLNNNTATYSYIDYINRNVKQKNYQFHRYTNSYISVENIMNDINNDTKDINYYIKNANLITISLGTEELYNYNELNNEIIIDYLNNFYTLLKSIRHLNKNEVYIINVYDDSYAFINKKIRKYAKDLHIKYIGIADFSKNAVYQINNKSYLSYKDHQKLANLIINTWNKCKKSQKQLPSEKNMI